MSLIAFISLFVVCRHSHHIFWTGEFLQADYDPDGNHFLGAMEKFLDPNNVYYRSMLIATFPDSTVKVLSQTFYDTWYQKYAGITERIAINHK